MTTEEWVAVFGHGFYETARVEMRETEARSERRREQAQRRAARPSRVRGRR